MGDFRTLTKEGQLLIRKEIPKRVYYGLMMACALKQHEKINPIFECLKSIDSEKRYKIRSIKLVNKKVLTFQRCWIN